MSKLLDFYADADEFEIELDAAESNARGWKTEEFLDGLRDKYEEWGEDMYLSEAQHAWLQRLADGD